ncbi:hypothetical protein D3C85_1234160 [compost metagenome]
MHHRDALVIRTFGKSTRPGDIVIEIGIGVVDHGLWHQHFPAHLDQICLVRDNDLIALFQLNVGNDAFICHHDFAKGLDLASLVHKLHDQFGLFGADGGLPIRTGWRGEHAALQSVE